jgi:hypothetical protein
VKRGVFSTKRRIVAAAIGVAALVATGSGLAAAAFSARTTSAQNVGAGTYHWAITGGGAPTSGPAALLPGTPPQVFTFHVQDTGTLHEHFVDSDLSVTVTSHVPSCPPSDFVTTLDTHGATGETLSPGGQVTVTVSAALDTTVTTDACEGSSPTVALTISAAD